MAILKAGFGARSRAGAGVAGPVGFEGRGEVRVRLPRDVAAAAVTRAHAAATSARGAGPTVVVEGGPRTRRSTSQDDTVATSSSADVAAGLFSRLMGLSPGRIRARCGVQRCTSRFGT